jgi:hypothetical protein
MSHILAWGVWTIAFVVYLVHVLLSCVEQDGGVRKLERRYSWLLLVGLALTLFTSISKYHLLWWAPTMFVFNMWLTWSYAMAHARRLSSYLDSHDPN